MKGLSFRLKLMLAYAAIALLAVFGTFVGGSYYVNKLQKDNIKEALHQARLHARAAVREIVESSARENARDLEDPKLREQLQTVTRLNLKLNDQVVWAAIITAEGDRTIEESYRDDQKLQSLQAEDGPKSSTIPLESGENLEVELSNNRITERIVRDGEHMGDYTVQLADSMVRIQEQSRDITRTLLFGCLAMLLFLLMVFLILWRLFSKQLSLEKHNEKLDRMAYVGTLASGLAHEIRNPLSSMNVNLEVLREELADNADPDVTHSRELAGRVQSEVLQLNSTLTSFLDFALPRREGYSSFAIRDLLEELKSLHEEQLRQKEIVLEIDGPSSLATVVEADRRLLHQAFRNIIVNAIQAVQDSIKPKVQIEIELIPRDFIRVSICDTGPGISENQVAQIFEVFYTTRKGGSGFGLAIARKIIEDHGGTIAARNQVDKRGACFVIELPRLATADIQELQQSIAPTHSPARI